MGVNQQIPSLWPRRVLPGDNTNILSIYVDILLISWMGDDIPAEVNFKNPGL